MKYSEHTRRVLDLRAKAIIIASLCVAFTMAFIPLWQIGSTTAVRFETAKVQERIDELDKEDRALRASISEINRDNLKSELTQILASI